MPLGESKPPFSSPLVMCSARAGGQAARSSRARYINKSICGPLLLSQRVSHLRQRLSRRGSAARSSETGALQSWSQGSSRCRVKERLTCNYKNCMRFRQSACTHPGVLGGSREKRRRVARPSSVGCGPLHLQRPASMDAQQGIPETRMSVGGTLMGLLQWCFNGY